MQLYKGNSVPWVKGVINSFCRLQELQALADGFPKLQDLKVEPAKQGASWHQVSHTVLPILQSGRYRSCVTLEVPFNVSNQVTHSLRHGAYKQTAAYWASMPMGHHVGTGMSTAPISSTGHPPAVVMPSPTAQQQSDFVLALCMPPLLACTLTPPCLLLDAFRADGWTPLQLLTDLTSLVVGGDLEHHDDCWMLDDDGLKVTYCCC